jgi:zinc protease
MIRRIALIAGFLVIAGCPSPPPPNPPPAPTVHSTVATTPQTRPTLSAPRPFKAPTPQVYRTSSGIKVWLVERRGLPVVSIRLAIPTGSADDSPGKGGLAHITASMMDEGAGDRDALAISTELNDIGASLSTAVERDGSRLGITVLTKHLDAAFPIFADVVSRPSFDKREWDRVTKLWHTQLERRGDNPGAVAAVVRYALLYGPDTPYGHPTSGNLDTAKAITLADVKRHHRSAWRPDRAMMVVVGDIDKARLDGLVDTHLANWKGAAGAAADPGAAPKPLASRPKMVLVDRPDAPQAVIALCAPGVAAADPKAPLLDLINTALGGSFTSRLNQNLREDHGWTYGARSSFVETLGVGPFVASAAVFTKVTAPALKEMVREVELLADEGLTDDELRKVRAQDLTDMIQTNQTVDGLSSRLTDLAIMRLSPDFDAKASEARQSAAAPQLAALAKEYLDVSRSTILVVGPKDELLPQLRALDRGTPEIWTAEGRPTR